jgi:hypothetical protein
MLRRALLLGVPLLTADDRTDAADAVAPLASALSEADDAGILRAVPKELEELRRNLLALVARAEVTSSVQVVSAESGTAELDWYMEIRNRTTETVVERRRGKVVVRFRRRKLTSLEPASFFAPPSVQ